MRKPKNRMVFILLSIVSVFVLFPILYTVTNSFMNTDEIYKYYSTDQSAMLHIIPDDFSLDAYYQILFRRPDYLVKFWNSLGLTMVIVLGQVIISTLAGYAFAKFNFKFKNTLLFLVIILMMMPYQVTLVTNYIVLDKMDLIGSYWAIILPSIFSPFGVFLMRQVMASMPTSILEAGKMDGANQLQLLFKIVIPRSKGGIIALVILSFVDNWNMVEQPLVFLDDPYKYPLSVFLSSVNSSQPDLAFACGVLAMLPVVLLFLFFEKELIEGIGFSNLK